jgi:hypothetical protein
LWKTQSRFLANLPYDAFGSAVKRQKTGDFFTVKPGSVEVIRLCSTSCARARWGASGEGLRGFAPHSVAGALGA